MREDMLLYAMKLYSFQRRKYQTVCTKYEKGGIKNYSTGETFTTPSIKEGGRSNDT